MTNKPLTITLKYKFLERVAEFYEFPVAVFFGDEKMFTTKTRNQFLHLKAKKLDKIMEILECQT